MFVVDCLAFQHVAAHSANKSASNLHEKHLSALRMGTLGAATSRPRTRLVQTHAHTKMMPGQFIRRVEPPQTDPGPVIIDIIHLLAQFASVRFEQLYKLRVRASHMHKKPYPVNELWQSVFAVHFSTHRQAQHTWSTSLRRASLHSDSFP